MDRRLLRVIIDDYDGGPVGVETLAAALGEPRDTIEDVYEPYLLQQGFLGRTTRGRVATRKAYEHLRVALHARTLRRDDLSRQDRPLGFDVRDSAGRCYPLLAARADR